MATRTEPTALTAARVIAIHEVRSALRGRMVPAFALLFAICAVGITLAGLSASGQIIVQGFTRTAVSLLVLSVYLLPLVGLIMGSSAFGSEDGGTELLMAQPLNRRTAFLGRVAGLTLCVIGVAFAGFGAAAAVVLTASGAAGFGGYALVAFSATALGIVGLQVGVLTGILVRRRVTAVGWALAIWLGAAVLYDLATITLLQVVGSGHPGPMLLGLLALNPIDGVRVFGIVALGADILLGPAGAAVQRMLAGAGWVLIWTSLLAWLLLPLAFAGRIHARRDF